jgi:hypothetical protein
VTVSDKDQGYSALVSRIFGLDSPKISVGIHEEDGAHDHEGLTVVALAAIHEFGLGVPERSFIRAWFDENESRAAEALRRLLVSVIEEKRSPNQALEAFALWAVGEIQARMARGIAPELAESTIARKGSSVPLIDTGQLRSSISYQILGSDGETVKKHGTSEAAVARHKAEQTKVRDKKAGEKKAARARAKERKQVRRDVKKTIKKTTRAVKKSVKKASRAVKRKLR